MTTVYLIRHGRTRGNLERRYVGASDEPLCPEGRAELAGRTPPEADRIYVSPLRRCRETAELLFPDRAAEIVPGFRECDFGAFEGHTYEELKDDPAYRAWLDTAGLAAPPGGESRERQQTRTEAAFWAIAADWRDGERVALVVHGGTVMCLMAALEPGHDFYRWQIPNGGCLRCRWDGETLAAEDDQV